MYQLGVCHMYEARPESKCTGTLIAVGNTFSTCLQHCRVAWLLPFKTRPIRVVSLAENTDRISRQVRNSRRHSLPYREVEGQVEIYNEVETVNGNGIMNRTSVYKWCHEFQNGRTSVHYDQRSGRPSIVTDELIPDTRNNHRNSRISEIVCEVGPKQLTEQHKLNRVQSSIEFTERYELEDDNFLLLLETKLGLPSTRLKLRGSLNSFLLKFQPELFPSQ
ncbi:hypothetical protein J6590_000456 [Homalodisca vitripennis]|nr:hypothetical protein J6590_000456 [Homalodisca vitripennis]